MEQGNLRTMRAAAEGLLAGFESVDREMAEHCRRVSALSARLGAAAGLSPSACVELEIAGLLHDVGKFGVPATILRKPGPLSPGERSLVQEHARAGADIVARIGSLQGFVDAVAHHHERWDGAGYPARIGGEEIPLAARVIAIADAWDAMVQLRGYAPTRGIDEARSEILRCAGTQFDPALAHVFAHAVVGALEDRPMTANAA